jgi:hypothetical protein
MARLLCNEPEGAVDGGCRLNAGSGRACLSDIGAMCGRNPVVASRRRDPDGC